MELEDVMGWIENNDFDSKNAEALALFLQDKINKKDQAYRKISQDDIERIRLVGLLISKKESLQEHRMITIGGEEWREIGEVFSKLKFILDDLAMNRIISYLGFSLGGGGHFQLVEVQRYIEFLYDEVKAILEKIQKTQAPKSVSKELEPHALQERDDTRMLQQLEHFKRFVERDGYLAFWSNSAPKNDLKNYPEEIGRGELMGFLAGLGFFDKGTDFREVHEGAGRSDIVRVEIGGTKRLFEVKVISEEQNRFEEGFDQLFEYMQKEGVDVSFYVVYEARSKEKRTRLVGERNKNGKMVSVIVIDLCQLGPTSKQDNHF